MNHVLESCGDQLEGCPGPDVCLPQKSHITHRLLPRSSTGRSTATLGPAAFALWGPTFSSGAVSVAFLQTPTHRQGGGCSRLALGVPGFELGEGQAPTGELQMPGGVRVQAMVVGSKGQPSQASTREETAAFSQPKSQI